MDNGNGQAEVGEWQQWMGIALALIEDGVSQAELAVQLDWTPGKVHRLATGKQKPKGDDIFRIAAVQDRPLAWYLYGPARPDPNRVKGLERELAAFSYNQLPLPLLVA